MIIMKNKFLSISIGTEELQTLLKALPFKNSNEPYVLYEVNATEGGLKIYQSKKGMTLLIKANDPKQVLNQYLPHFKMWKDNSSQIGSDEVGVGDFLLPMIVVATYVGEKELKLIEEFGIKDSKKLSDAKIMEIGQRLSKEISFSKLTLSNEKYNEMIAKGENLNTLKAKMHNKALINVYAKHKDANYIYVDQFVNVKTYYSYLKNEKNVINENVVFETKGESSYPSVALSSVIARYAFLLEKAKLEKKYGLLIPKGCNQNVIDFAHQFIKKFSLTEFSKIAKQDFSTYKKIIKAINPDEK